MESEVLQALEALRAASKDIETNSVDESGGNSPSMKALLELETAGSLHLFNNDPKLTTLSSLLSRLKSLASSLHHHRHRRRRRRSLFGGSNEISRIAGSIGSELQSWIDRQSIHSLISSSSSSIDDDDDEQLSTLLIALESRLAQGFDPVFQDLLLRSSVFSAVQSLLASPSSSKKLRDRAASATLAFVRFNKHVFVGEVLMGPTVRNLVSVSSAASIRVLSGLISSIRSPLVDELHARGDIAKVVSLLCSSGDDDVRIAAFETVLEIGYYGRKEAVEAMLEEGLIEKLIELQASPEVGGALVEMEGEVGREGVKVGGVERERRGEEERRYLERRPFASCVSRFSIQLEVGEGLRQREKRAVKLEVLRRVREVEVVREAEGATIIAEVLWGPTLW